MESEIAPEAYQVAGEVQRQRGGLRLHRESNICNGTISAMLTYDGNTAEAMATMGENNTLVIAPFTKDPVQPGLRPVRGSQRVLSTPIWPTSS